ncbi:hypothetical protein PRUPE_7G043300 [Prunus persica]|uniref:Pentatricopeptide repeat-containing protein n=1 Tax=Prunus persica TaxID=3760 RepID=A0A251N9P6_PRUPE|nr:hypothetical protein PRUPE_7G043300 [Prunus persica]
MLKVHQSSSNFSGRTLELFGEMVSLEQKPDGFTFIVVLIACSHARLVKEGLKYFNQMQSLYGIDPKIEHYACVVDMLGRSGQFMYHHAPYGTYATSLLNLLLNVNFVLCKYFLMPLPIWFKIQDLDKPPLM